MVFILFMVCLHTSRKQFIWYGHVERMDPMRLPKIMINWKPEGRWNIYSHEWKRSQNGRMEQSKAMEYGSRKASLDVLKPRNLYTFARIYASSLAGGRMRSILYRAHPSTFRTNQNNNHPDRLFLQRHHTTSVWMDSSIAWNIQQQGHRHTGPWLLNFVLWLLLFVGLQYAPCFMSLFWRSEFWGGS
jgi:hypothetical protein